MCTLRYGPDLVTSDDRAAANIGWTIDMTSAMDHFRAATGVLLWEMKDKGIESAAPMNVSLYAIPGLVQAPLLLVHTLSCEDCCNAAGLSEGYSMGKLTCVASMDEMLHFTCRWLALIGEADGNNGAYNDGSAMWFPAWMREEYKEGIAQLQDQKIIVDKDQALVFELLRILTRYCYILMLAFGSRVVPSMYRSDLFEGEEGNWAPLTIHEVLDAIRYDSLVDCSVEFFEEMLQESQRLMAEHVTESLGAEKCFVRPFDRFLC